MIIKRIFDILASFMLIIVLFPVMFVCAIAIKLNDKGPVFFWQERLGYRTKTFWVIKFRTMIPNAVNQGTGFMTFRDDPRITKVGKFLRNYRLDELPQLFNVLLGQMSLVGPRPLLPRDIHAYSDFDKRRMEVPPGMTGWQQVNGASNHNWEQRINYDVWYVDHRSFWLDAKILFLTVKVVIKPTDVYDKDGQQLSGVPTALRDKSPAQEIHSSSQENESSQQ